MTAFVLGLPEHKVRVIAPDVGGGFGSKIYLYAEETAMVWASTQTCISGVSPCRARSSAVRASSCFSRCSSVADTTYLGKLFNRCANRRIAKPNCLT